MHRALAGRFADDRAHLLVGQERAILALLRERTRDPQQGENGAEREEKPFDHAGDFIPT